MKVKDLKMAEEVINWYSPLRLLVGAILSFADPITDILTLVEFYRLDHKTLFYLGLTSVLLPSLVFPLLYLRVRKETLPQHSDTRKCWQTLLCGFHPFSAAFVMLERFVYYLRKWWSGDEEQEPIQNVLTYIEMAVVFESVLESAPQFLIQIYVVLFLDQEVKLIQMISLPISFVSLVWASTIVDKMLHESVGGVGNLHLARRVGFFVANLFSLGIRLFVILFFTVSYKWWIVVAMLSHNFVMLTLDIILCYKNLGKCELGMAFFAIFNFCLYWLKDNVSLLHFVGDFDRKILRSRQRFANCLFVLENTSMFLVPFVHGGNSTVGGYVAMGLMLFVSVGCFTCVCCCKCFSRLE